MTFFFRFLNDIYYRLFGSTKLRSYEKICIDAWEATLSAESKDVFSAQLKQPYFVQRQAGDAKVCFYWHREDRLPRFKDAAPDLNVAIVTLKSKGNEKATLKAKIFTHRGRFFSIEFPKRPERYAKLQGMDLATLSVASIETLVAL